MLQNLRKFYHYTTAMGAKAISETKMILQSDASQGGNARFGTAVYLTQKTPELPRKAIYLNNYDDRPNQEMIENEARLDHVIELEIPADDENLVLVKDDSKRNVYKYTDNIDLKKFPHKIYPNPTLQ